MPTEEIDGNVLRINVFGLPNEEQRDCDLVPRPAGIRKTGVVKVLCLKGSETWPMTSSRMAQVISDSAVGLGVFLGIWGLWV